MLGANAVSIVKAGRNEPRAAMALCGVRANEISVGGAGDSPPSVLGSVTEGTDTGAAE